MCGAAANEHLADGGDRTDRTPVREAGTVFPAAPNLFRSLIGIRALIRQSSINRTKFAQHLRPIARLHFRAVLCRCAVIGRPGHQKRGRDGSVATAFQRRGGSRGEAVVAHLNGQNQVWKAKKLFGIFHGGFSRWSENKWDFS